MANPSILAAFERMWQHINAAIGRKADIDHDHAGQYCTESDVDEKIRDVSVDILIDQTLSVEGMAADAAAVGELAENVAYVGPIEGEPTNMPTVILYDANMLNGKTESELHVADAKTLCGKLESELVVLKAANADTLGGKPESELVVSKAANADTLGGKTEDKLSVANANTLGGKAPEYYIQPRNLLDNSDFRNPVNQRGEITHTGKTGTNTYFLDRWCTWSTLTHYTLNDDGLTITSNYSESLGPWQTFENHEKMLGKTYTLAVCYDDDKINCGVVAIPDAIGTSDYYLSAVSAKTDKVGLRFFVKADLSKIYMQIMIAPEDSHKVKWVACYEGAYTLDTLPPYVSKGYAAELAECHRYYCNSWDGDLTIKEDGYCQNTGVIWHASQADFFIQFPQVMRNIPTMTYYGSSGQSAPRIYHHGAYYDVGTISNNARYGLHGIYARLKKASTDTATWTPNDTAQFHAHWEASADL